MQEKRDFVIKGIKDYIAYIIKSDIKGYILIVGVFIAGVVLSSVVGVSSGPEEEMRLYVNDFMTSVKSYGTDSATTFGTALNGYLKTVIILLFMSLTVVGSAGVLTYVFVRGFAYGTVMFSVFNILGTKACLFFLCAVLPHGIIMMPAFLLYSLYCMKHSLYITKGAKELVKAILVPLAYGIVCLGFLTVSALIQAYLEPVLIKLIL